MFIRSDLDVGVGAGDGDVFICREVRSVALTLAAEFAASGVELDAGVGCGVGCFICGVACIGGRFIVAVFFVFFGFAVGKETNAVFHQMMLAALAAEINVLVGADVTCVACGNQGVSSGTDTYACWAGELEMRFTVGGDGVCVDAAFCADDLQAMRLLGDGVNGFVRFVCFCCVAFFQNSLVLFCRLRQGLLQLVALF